MNHEKLTQRGPERKVEVAFDAHERPQELGEKLKRNAERQNSKEAHHAAEKARNEALHEAAFSKEQGREHRTPQADRHNSSARHIITKKDREQSFNQTMTHVRKELPLSTRWFSDLIHKPKIERWSETIGNTLARPSAMLAGGLTAFVAVLGVYSYARFAGFTLQGSETIVAFGVGWLIGLLFDGIKNLFNRK